MYKLKNAVALETTFTTYLVDELLGEGGAGRVFGGTSEDGLPVAVKVLSPERSSKANRRRFKNEVAFLSQNRHKKVVTVIDHGFSQMGDIVGPFYVMRRYHSNLRNMLREGISPDEVLGLFLQILEGVEAAHLQGVVHRDLKPENILFDEHEGRLAVADFGIASFTEDFLVTQVQTGPRERLANFQYAAPEQRSLGKPVRASADVYALGLILNEMFTGEVPYGTEYRQIARVSEESGYLDGIVETMLRQAPEDRPPTIADVKGLLQRYHREAIAAQRLSKFDGTVISAPEVDEPLAQQPPRLIDFDWEDGQLTLVLDRPVTQEWINALYRMGDYSFVGNKMPQIFRFQGNRAFVQSRHNEVQPIIDHFKNWLPKASEVLRASIADQARREEAQRMEEARREREAEERRLWVIRNTKI